MQGGTVAAEGFTNTFIEIPDDMHSYPLSCPWFAAIFVSNVTYQESVLAICTALCIGRCTPSLPLTCCCCPAVRMSIPLRH